MAEPGTLSLGVLAAAGDGMAYGCFWGTLALQTQRELLKTKGARDGGRRKILQQGEVALELPHLLQGPFRHHLPKTSGNAALQPLSAALTFRWHQTQGRKRVGRGALEGLGLPKTEGLS